MSESIGDARSLLAQLYDACRPSLLRFLQQRLGDRHAAEDAMQESFTRFVASGAASAPEKQRPYLFQIAANLLHDQARERARVGGGTLSLDYEDANLPVNHVSPSAFAEHRQRLARLAQALEELPERQREAFVLHRFDGYTQDEVARFMNISRRMVTKHLSRALAYCELRVQYASLEQMRALAPQAETKHAGDDE